MVLLLFVKMLLITIIRLRIQQKLMLTNGKRPTVASFQVGKTPPQYLSIGEPFQIVYVSKLSATVLKVIGHVKRLLFRRLWKVMWMLLFVAALLIP